MNLQTDLQTEKLDLIQWISRLNDTSVIATLKQVKEDYSKSEDWWDTLENEEFESINRGLKNGEIDRNRIIELGT